VFPFAIGTMNVWLVVVGSVAVGTATSYVPLEAVISPLVRKFGRSVAMTMSVAIVVP
jgi:hypothetical protein